MKKVFVKYLMMYIPFVSGGVLFSMGVTKLFSSLLLFVGGYIAIKNTLDYRLVKRNISKLKKESVVRLDENLFAGDVSKESRLLGNKTSMENKKNQSISIKPINYNVEDMVGIKRIRRYFKVRRRY